jgi:cell wall-associated NlpC family hydrolase
MPFNMDKFRTDAEVKPNQVGVATIKPAASTATTTPSREPKARFDMDAFRESGEPKKPEFTMPKPKTAFGITVQESILDSAQKYKGVKYKLGGDGINTVDCSLLVQKSFKDVGINIPRTAAAQHAIAKPIKAKDAKPGDLVYFKATDEARKGKIIHTGIYAGDGKIFEASAGKTRAVTLNDMGSGWYQNHFAGFGRIEHDSEDYGKKTSKTKPKENAKQPPQASSFDINKFLGASPAPKPSPVKLTNADLYPEQNAEKALGDMVSHAMVKKSVKAQLESQGIQPKIPNLIQTLLDNKVMAAIMGVDDTEINNNLSSLGFKPMTLEANANITKNVNKVVNDPHYRKLVAEAVERTTKAAEAEKKKTNQFLENQQRVNYSDPLRPANPFVPVQKIEDMTKLNEKLSESLQLLGSTATKLTIENYIEPVAGIKVSEKAKKQSAIYGGELTDLASYFVHPVGLARLALSIPVMVQTDEDGTPGIVQMAAQVKESLTNPEESFEKDPVGTLGNWALVAGLALGIAGRATAEVRKAGALESVQTEIAFQRGAYERLGMDVLGDKIASGMKPKDIVDYMFNSAENNRVKGQKTPAQLAELEQRWDTATPEELMHEISVLWDMGTPDNIATMEVLVKTISRKFGTAEATRLMKEYRENILKTEPSDTVKGMTLGEKMAEFERISESIIKGDTTQPQIGLHKELTAELLKYGQVPEPMKALPGSAPKPSAPPTRGAPAETTVVEGSTLKPDLPEVPGVPEAPLKPDILLDDVINEPSAVKSRLDVIRDEYIELSKKIDDGTATKEEIQRAEELHQEMVEILNSEREAVTLEDVLLEDTTTDTPAPPSQTGLSDRFQETRYVLAKDVYVNPVLQFRTNITDTENKVTDKLKGMPHYDVLKGGYWTLWQSKEGVLYAVNAHHRRELAQRPNIPYTFGLLGEISDRHIPAHVMYEEDGVTIERARLQGAIENMMDGNATITDAAMIAKELGMTPDAIADKYALSKRTNFFKYMKGLHGASDGVIERVRGSVLTEEAGAGIGAVPGADETTQAEAAKYIISRNIKTYEEALRITEKMQDAIDENAASAEQGNLFGDSDDPFLTDSVSTLAEQMDIEDAITRMVIDARNEQIRALGVTEGEGETINYEERKRLADEMGKSSNEIKERYGYVFSLNQEAKGLVREQAIEVKNGRKTTEQAAREIREAISGIASRDLNDIIRGNDSQGMGGNAPLGIGSGRVRRVASRVKGRIDAKNQLQGIRTPAQDANGAQIVSQYKKILGDLKSAPGFKEKFSAPEPFKETTEWFNQEFDKYLEADTISQEQYGELNNTLQETFAEFDQPVRPAQDRLIDVENTQYSRAELTAMDAVKLINTAYEVKLSPDVFTSRRREAIKRGDEAARLNIISEIIKKQYQDLLTPVIIPEQSLVLAPDKAKKPEQKTLFIGKGKSAKVVDDADLIQDGYEKNNPYEIKKTPLPEQLLEPHAQIAELDKQIEELNREIADAEKELVARRESAAQIPEDDWTQSRLIEEEKALSELKSRKYELAKERLDKWAAVALESPVALDWSDNYAVDVNTDDPVLFGDTIEYMEEQAANLSEDEKLTQEEHDTLKQALDDGNIDIINEMLDIPHHPSNNDPMRSDDTPEQPQRAIMEAGDIQTKIIRLREVLEKLRQSGGNKIMSIGRRGGGHTAYFNPGTRTEWSHEYPDIDTLTHEGGHDLDDRFGLHERVEAEGGNALAQLEALGMNGRLSSYVPLAHPYERMLQEGMAEFFRYYVVNRGMLEQGAPDLLKFLSDELSQMPDSGKPQRGLARGRTPKRSILDAQNEVTELYLDILSQSPVERVAAVTLKVGEGNKIVKKADRRPVSQKVNEATYDILNPFKVALKEMFEKDFDEIKLKYNVYLAAEKAQTSRVRAYKEQDKLVKQLRKFKDRSKGNINVWTYLVAKRARYLESVGKGTRGIRKGDAQKVIDFYEDLYPDWPGIALEFYEYWRDFAQMYEANFFGSRMSAEIDNLDACYIPWNAIGESSLGEEFDMTRVSSKGGFADQKIGYFKYDGKNLREIIHPLESMTKRIFTSMATAEKNEVPLTMVRAARKTHNGRYWEVVPLANVPENVLDKIWGLIRQKNPQVLQQEEWQDLVDAITAIDDTEFISWHAKLVTSLKDKQAKIVWAMQNGKPIFIQIHDPGVYNAITYVGQDGSNLFQKTMHVGAQITRSNVVFNPQFLFWTNLLADHFGGVILSRGKLIPGYSLIRGLWHGFLHTSLKDDAIDAGAIGAGSNALTPEVMEKEALQRASEIRIYDFQDLPALVNHLLNLGVQYAKRVGDASESAGRIVFYEADYLALKADHEKLQDAGLETGDDVWEEEDYKAHAGHNARALVDFIKAGSLTQPIYGLTAFLKANVNAFGNIIENLTVGGFTAKGRRRKTQIMTRLIAFLAGLYAVEFFMNHDNPVWQTRNDADAINYICFPIPGTNELARLKTAHVWGPTVGLWVRGMLSEYYDKEPIQFAELAHQTMEGLYIEATPQVMQEIIALSGNKQKFSGRDIVPDYLMSRKTGVDPAEQYNKYTITKVPKILGRATGTSPQKIQYFFESMGPLMKHGVSLVDIIASEFTPEDPSKRNLNLFPGVKTQSDMIYTAPLAKYIEAVDKITMQRNTVRSAFNDWNEGDEKRFVDVEYFLKKYKMSDYQSGGYEELINKYNGLTGRTKEIYDHISAFYDYKNAIPLPENQNKAAQDELKAGMQAEKEWVSDTCLLILNENGIPFKTTKALFAKP